MNSVASTCEGSAIEECDVHVAKRNYSAMPPDGTQNGAAGDLLAGFCTNNRMIDGPENGFIVRTDRLRMRARPKYCPLG